MGRPKGSKNKQEASPEPSEQQEQQPKQSSEYGKFIFLVRYWVPFPSSEYGGLQVVIAADDEECFKLIAEHDEFEIKYHNDWKERMKACIARSDRFPLAMVHDSRFVREFTT